MGAFRGFILGTEYTDRKAFERAARDAGHRFGMMDRTGDWRVGLPCRFVTDSGEKMDGQVWAKGSQKGTVILALGGRHYARVHTYSGLGDLIDSRGHTLAVSGKVQ